MQNSPLKIALIYDCIYPESLGGVEHRNYRLAQALAHRGHAITLAGWTQESGIPFKGVTVLPMALRSKLYDNLGRRTVLTSLKFALACLKLDLRPYDIIETASVPYIHLIPLAIRCALLRKPLVITWYEYWGQTWQTYKGRWLSLPFALFEKICAQFGSKLNTTSVLTLERLKKVRLRPTKIELIPCGIDIKQMTAFAAKPSPSTPPLLYAGRLMKEKRLDLLLKALPKLPDVSLGLVGDGPDRKRLEEMAKNLGVASRVTFYGRLPSSDDVWRMLAQTRIALQPSEREGFGMFPLEAMALGIPVVYCASDDSAVGAIVRDGVEGICAQPDPDSIAAAINRILKDEALWTLMHENAEKRGRSYAWDTIAEQMERFFLQEAS